MVSRCIVFGASPEFDPQCAAYYIKGGVPFIACADGGIRHALRCGLRPDLVVGDGDSGDMAGVEAKKVLLPTAKDVTDLHALLDELLGRGVDEFVLLGCTGGRLDHTLGALCLLQYLHEKGACGLVADAKHEVFYHPGGRMEVENPRGLKYLSIVPLDNDLLGVTLQGLKYPLDRAHVTRSFPLALSNEYAGDGPAVVEILEGRALVVLAGE